MTGVIYLHGFASSPNSRKAMYFRRQLEAIGASVDVPDLAQGDFEHLTISGQLAAVERAAAGRPVALIGSSLGGYLAALYAARHPEVSRLVLLAPAFGFVTEWPERLGAEAVELWRRTGTREVFHYADARMRPLGYPVLSAGSGSTGVSGVVMQLPTNLTPGEYRVNLFSGGFISQFPAFLPVGANR